MTLACKEPVWDLRDVRDEYDAALRSVRVSPLPAIGESALNLALWRAILIPRLRHKSLTAWPSTSAVLRLLSPPLRLSSPSVRP